MTDHKDDAEEAQSFVLVYREDEKAALASKDSKSDYAMLKMSTLAVIEKRYFYRRGCH
jgi:hypothetical protein